MQVVADLEVHSKYARAVSSQMVLPTIAEWADKKGIDLVGTGDFTHPMWLREIEANLIEDGDGILKLKDDKTKARFLLTSEVSCMYKHNGKGRRVHILVYLPTLSAVKKFNSELTNRGANLFSDGRPIMGLSLAQIAEIALMASEQAIIIPAHVWTPWFGFYGHMSGYDSLFEAFGDLEKYIPAVETGLSSDPAMNWRIAELVGKQIVSFGDAHSPAKLGREATVFELPKLTYENIYKALSPSQLTTRPKTHPHIAYTIEFYPEEGKYHYSGHRKCSVVRTPNETRKLGMTCPVCGKNLTMGVMSRVESLASNDVETESETDEFGVRFIKDKDDKHPKYVMLVPLHEILAESLGVGVGSKQVNSLYESIVEKFGTEFEVLMKTPVDEISKMAGPRVSEAISKVRLGDIAISPGYDGVFGKVAIWKHQKTQKIEAIDQGALF